MPTTTVNAVLAYWPGSVAGQARQGVYSGQNYSGQMAFDFSAIGDLTNIDITGIALAFHVGELGGAYTKYLYLKQGGRNGAAVGNYSFTGCRNANKSLSFSPSGNAGGFNALKAYIEGISGGSVVILGVNNTYGSRGSASGKTYDYDYMNITSASMALTYTYKKSTGSVGAASTGSAATLNITAYNSAYSHKVTWKLGSWTATQTVAAGTVSASYTIPHSALPNSTSGTATVTLETLNGSTSLGSNTYSFSVTVPSSVVPAISSFTAAPAYGGSRPVSSAAQGWGLYIQHFSWANLAISGATAGSGASLKTYTITCSAGASIYSGGSGSISSGSATAESDWLEQAGSVTFTAKVTDSRGRTATKTVTITVRAYAAPVFTATPAIYRCTSNGTRDDTGGTYARLSASFSYSSVNGNNSLTVKRVTLNGVNTNLTSGTAVTLGAGALAVDNTYTAIITLTDAVGSTTTYTLTVPSAAYVLHVRKGGKSVGIGQAAPSGDGKLGIGWDTAVDGRLDVTGAVALQSTLAVTGRITGSGRIDAYNNFVRCMSGINAAAANNGLSSWTDAGGVYVLDSSNRTLGVLYIEPKYDGTIAAFIQARNYDTSGTQVATATFGFRVAKDGTVTYSVPSPKALRDALGLGNTSGALPVPNGGTGAATALGARQNLEAALGKYTTGEVQTGGTWTDGKTIYRYVCSGTTSSTGTIDTGKTLPRTPGNVISITGAVKDSDGIWRALSYASYGNLNQMVSAAVNASNKIMLYIGSAVTGTKTYNIVVEYTGT